MTRLVSLQDLSVSVFSSLQTVTLGRAEIELDRKEWRDEPNESKSTLLAETQRILCPSYYLFTGLNFHINSTILHKMEENYLKSRVNWQKTQKVRNDHSRWVKLS